MAEPGVLTISLDTELAWGLFDRDGWERYEGDYRATPRVIRGLCSLFDDFDVSATWAFVAHLFDPCSGTHPYLQGAPQAGSLPCQADFDRDLWYAPELLSTVADCGTRQDVGLHGYTHLIFDENSPTLANRELETAVEVAREHGLDPRSFVFPRNRIAHVDLLSKHGIRVFRGQDARWYETDAVPGLVRKPLRYTDEIRRRTPPVVTPEDCEDIVSVPGSMPFRPEHGWWAYTPGDAQVSRACRGLQRAAATGRILHLWWHPFNFGREPDRMLSLVERVLSYANDLRAEGRLEVKTLPAIAADYRSGRWQS